MVSKRYVHLAPFISFFKVEHRSSPVRSLTFVIDENGPFSKVECQKSQVQSDKAKLMSLTLLFDTVTYKLEYMRLCKTR